MFRLGVNIFRDSVDPNGMLYEYFIATNWLHYTIFLFIFSIVLIILVSLVTPKATAVQLASLTYGSATPEEAAETRNSWDKWDVIHTVIIISIVGAFYAYFW
jgi:SSS family solute:Na+ symporter